MCSLLFTDVTHACKKEHKTISQTEHKLVTQWNGCYWGSTGFQFDKVIKESVWMILNIHFHMSYCTVKKSWALKSWRQPASADFWVFSTFCCINLKQQVEKTHKSAEAGCLQLLSLLNFFFVCFLQYCTSWEENLMLIFLVSVYS